MALREFQERLPNITLDLLAGMHKRSILAPDIAARRVNGSDTTATLMARLKQDRADNPDRGDIRCKAPVSATRGGHE